MTTREDVRKDPEDGRYYVWEITESDIPGEGGQRRVTELTMVNCTRHELALRELLEQIKDNYETTQNKLKVVLGYKQLLESEGLELETDTKLLAKPEVG